MVCHADRGTTNVVSRGMARQQDLGIDPGVALATAVDRGALTGHQPLPTRCMYVKQYIRLDVRGCIRITALPQKRSAGNSFVIKSTISCGIGGSLRCFSSHASPFLL